MLLELAKEFAVGRIEHADGAVAFISHQQIVAERAELAGRQRHSPWRVERRVLETHDQVALGIELVDLADRLHPHRVGNKHVAVDRGDVVRGETGRQSWIRKSSGGGNRIEVGIEYVNRPLAIGRVEQVRGAIVRQRQPCVHLARVGDYRGCGGANTLVPSRDRSVLGGEDEQRRRAARNRELAGGVADDTGWFTGTPGGGPGDRNKRQRLHNLSFAVDQFRDSRPFVIDPEGSGSGGDECSSPGVNHVRVFLFRACPIAANQIVDLERRD